MGPVRVCVKQLRCRLGSASPSTAHALLYTATGEKSKPQPFLLAHSGELIRDWHWLPIAPLKKQ
eukprot:111797-Prorocentrum_lima.AAC.1